MRGPFTTKEVAELLGATSRTVRRKAKNPAAHGWKVEETTSIRGTVAIQIWLPEDAGEKADIETPKADISTPKADIGPKMSALAPSEPKADIKADTPTAKADIEPIKADIKADILAKADIKADIGAKADMSALAEEAKADIGPKMSALDEAPAEPPKGGTPNLMPPKGGTPNLEPEPEDEAVAEKAPVECGPPGAPLEYKMEKLLHTKCVGKTPQQARATRAYYWKKFRRTGCIPKGLYERDARKLSGRKRVMDDEMEARFVALVKRSAEADPDEPDHITRPLRKVSNYQRLLRAEFGVNPPAAGLHRAIQRHALKAWINRPDYPDQDDAEAVVYFKSRAPFELIQMDGCVFRYFRIKDEKGQWRKPQVIETMDTGSRYMFAITPHFSESNEASIEHFSEFLTSTEFPHRAVVLRPDNAGGFVNLGRPAREINREYSRPEGFFLDFAPARAHAPKQKVHLESSHRALHNYEAAIIDHFADRVAKKEPSYWFRPNGGREKITISYLDVTLEEFADSGLLEKYRRRHNETARNFAEDGRIVRWKPADRLAEALTEFEAFRIAPAHARSYAAYGYPKKKASVSANGRLTHDLAQWKLIEGDFFRGYKSVRVQISRVGDRLYLFEDRKDGLLIGQAILVGENEEPKFVQKRAEKRRAETEVERIAAMLERADIPPVMDRLAGLHADGLGESVAEALLKENAERYAAFDPEKRWAAFHVFVTHAREKISENNQPKVAPYADLEGRK